MFKSLTRLIGKRNTEKEAPYSLSAGSAAGSCCVCPSLLSGRPLACEPTPTKYNCIFKVTGNVASKMGTIFMLLCFVLETISLNDRAVLYLVSTDCILFVSLLIG